MSRSHRDGFALGTVADCACGPVPRNWLIPTSSQVPQIPSPVTHCCCCTSAVAEVSTLASRYCSLHCSLGTVPCYCKHCSLHCSLGTVPCCCKHCSLHCSLSRFPVLSTAVSTRCRDAATSMLSCHRERLVITSKQRSCLSQTSAQASLVWTIPLHKSYSTVAKAHMSYYRGSS